MRIVRGRPTVYRVGTPGLDLSVWAVVAILGTVMLTQVVGWSGTLLVAVVQSLTPYTTVALVLLALWASWRHRHRLAATAALVALGGLVIAAPVVFAAPPPEPAAGTVGLEIASINLLYSNDRIAAVGDLLVELDADVVVFHEFTAEHRASLLAHPVADRYPFRVDRDGLYAGGTAVWGRVAITEGARLDTVNYSLDVSVDGPDGRVRLIAVHPPTPVNDTAGWNADLRIIDDAAESADGPFVVVGDFNATYWHPPFRELLDGRVIDAHVAANDGWSASWPTDTWYPPFVRLDHALVGGGWTTVDVTDVDVPGSDHRGLSVTVAPARSTTP